MADLPFPIGTPLRCTRWTQWGTETVYGTVHDWHNTAGWLVLSPHGGVAAAPGPSAFIDFGAPGGVRVETEEWRFTPIEDVIEHAPAPLPAPPTEDDTERVERVAHWLHDEGDCDCLLPLRTHVASAKRLLAVLAALSPARPDPATVERARAEGREQGRLEQAREGYLHPCCDRHDDSPCPQREEGGHTLPCDRCDRESEQYALGREQGLRALREAAEALKEARVYIAYEAPHGPTDREMQRVIALVARALSSATPSAPEGES